MEANPNRETWNKGGPCNRCSGTTNSKVPFDASA